METFPVIVSILAMLGTLAVVVTLVISKTRSEDEIRSMRDSARRRKRYTSKKD